MTTALTKPTTLRPKPKASIVSVTPKDAKRWLAANGKNRPIRPRLVDAYARDMAAGNWQITGEAVKFATDGTLLDGQHRLSAVVAAGVAVDMLVVRGVSHESQEVMDSGAKRLASDALHLRDYKNTALLAATTRMALKVVTGGYDSIDANVTTFTTSEVTAFVDEHPELESYMQPGAHAARQLDCSPTVIAYAMWRLFAIDADAAGEFFEKATTKVGIAKGDPVLSMSRRFAEARRHRERLTHGASLSIVFRAWNATREGKTLDRIPISSRDGVVAVPEPK